MFVTSHMTRSESGMRADHTGGFRGKTLDNDFKLLACFTALGVLEQHKGPRSAVM